MASEAVKKTAPAPTKRPPKPKPINPIEAALKQWFQQLPPELQDGIHMSIDNIMSLKSTPKRWVVYPPMVLLPSGSFGDRWWKSLGFGAKTASLQTALWGIILDTIGKREGKGKLTHLAINAAIPLHKTHQDSDFKSGEEDGEGEGDNILRTPSGLITLHGFFGPLLPPSHPPTLTDFENAFWVHTKQNGISQIWAPRYTMFSRGNIKEKARLLDFHSTTSTSKSNFKGRGLSQKEIEESKFVAVDLYAGIGYFLFSYVKAGFRVWGWELNPWSAEALRRGAVMNGWSVKIITASETISGLPCEQIVVFLEDNNKAEKRLKALGNGTVEKVKHVNCGLLPSSEGSWNTALRVLVGEKGWIHVHENVGVDQVESKKKEIERVFRGLLEESDGRMVEVEHVEFVKTFAPGVWHCVFDVYIHFPKKENS